MLAMKNSLGWWFRKYYNIISAKAKGTGSCFSSRIQTTFNQNITKNDGHRCVVAFRRTRESAVAFDRLCV